MVAEFVKRFSYRFVFAILFVWRPSFVSIIYVVLALIGPAFPSIRKNIPTSPFTRAYLLVCVAVSLLLTILQFGYQLFEYFTVNDKTYEQECLDAGGDLNYWLRQTGFIRVPESVGLVGFRIIAPEIAALIGSITTLIICTVFQTDNNPDGSTDLMGVQTVPSSASSTNQNTVRSNQRPKLDFTSALVPSLKRVSDVLLMLCVVAIGAVQPSLLNATYFVIFLVVLTWWALYTPLKRNTFNAIKRFLILYSALHFLAIYIYQIQMVQDAIPPKDFLARLIGLTALVSSECTKDSPWWELKVPEYTSWTGYVNFAFLLFIYHLLVVQYSWTRNGVKGFGKSLLGGMSSGEDQEDGGSSVHEEQYALSELNNHSVVEQEEAGKKALLSNTGSEDFDAAQLPVQRITSEVLDRQKICMIVNGPNEKNTTMTAQGLQAFLYFGLYHCYVFALLAMMTWGLLYHSVFGLLFLVFSCVIWALRNSRKWSFALSPAILFYTEFLLLAQYVYSMDLKQELSHESYMKIIGFIFAENRTESFITLCVKILLSLPLFVLLRLHLREDYYNSLSDNDRLKRLTYGTFDISASSSRSAALQRIQANRTGENGGEAFGFITHFFIKYWIFVVITFLLINCPLTDSLRVYLYSIGFFVFFAALIVSLHISFTFFRKTIYLFLTVLIVYASVVLISVYTYQFRDVADFIHNHTILNKNWTEDIGLIVFENSANDVTLLFKSLILPISLIVVTMLQLKFFHDPWTKLVQGSGNGQTHRVATSGVDGAMNRAKHQSREVIEVLWRLAEVHGYRLILFVLVLVAVSHFCALNFIIIVFVALAACLPSLSRMISLLLCLYMSTVFIARRIYQLHLTQNSGITEEGSINRILDGGSCEQSKNDTLPEFQCASKWIGFEETNDLQSDLKGLVLVIVLIGLQLCVRYRQKHRRTMLGVPEPAPGTIFSEATPLSFDANILSCFKCLLNYGFYKFGLEISMSAMVIVAWFRMDFLAGMLIVWLVCFVVMSRAGCRVVWPVFLIYLAVLFPLQYAMAIGLPSEWGIEYPWTHILTDVDLDNNLSVFLDLANYNLPAERFYIFIICDAILLLIVAAQELVFRQEGESHPAGSNESIYKDGGYLLHKENPRYDFVVEQKSFVDFFKMVVFMYGHWITMIMLMAAGLGGTSLFALGYLVLAFWMLWQGNNLYTMYNYGRTIYWWKVIAVYTVVVMFLKIFLQLFGCAFLYTEFFTGNDLRPLSESSINPLCVLQQLFSLVCVNDMSSESINRFIKKHPLKFRDTECVGSAEDLSVLARETRIGFDTVAFIFVILQLRALNSWFFQRCMIEFRCEMIQARRGAILINQLIEKEMSEQNEHQNKKVEEIKRRTEAIRNRYIEQQQRASIGAFQEAFVADSYGQGHRRLSQTSITMSDAKRAGDYYMFDYDPGEDEPTKPPPGVPEVAPDTNELNPTQLLYTAICKNLDLDSTMEAVAVAESEPDNCRRMIIAVAKSKEDRERVLKALHRDQRPESRQAAELLMEMAQKEGHELEQAVEEDLGPVVRFRKTAGGGGRNGDDSPDRSETSSGKLEKHITEFADEAKASSKSWPELILVVFKFGWKVIKSSLGWVASFLNARSREHRYVAFVLNKEKERLKQVMNDELYDAQRPAGELRRQWEGHNVHLVTSVADIRKLENDAHLKWEQRNVFARLITAIANCFAAHTDVMCFFFAIIAHSFCGGLLTLPLPALVFFWGSLANPRPSKIFWIAMIFYTEVVIVIKFLFQFGFWYWNRQSAVIQETNEPYKLPYVLGIQKTNYFAVADVALLIALFFHRYMLRRLGLWKDANVQDTFSSSTVSTTITEPQTRLESPQRTSIVSGTSRKGSASKQKTKRNSQDQEEIDMETGLGSSTIQPSTSQAAQSMYATKDVADDSNSNNGQEDHSSSGAVVVFFRKLLYPKFRYIRDLYPIMFFLDVLGFFIVAFGYKHFGEGGTGDVLGDIQASRVPVAFVVMVILISFMIVIDRALYLRKAVFCKLAYQLITVIALHIWIFFVLPWITKRETVQNRIALLLYVVKCVYFLVSAWQIRNGYPSLCIGNLLTHSYGLINMVLFKAFMIVPFLFELRTAIDWTWTDTSMPLFDYFNMENFYAVIYNLKCARTYEQNFPAPRGVAKGSLVKYLMGLPMILFLIIIIWLPLVLFSMLNQIGEVSTPNIAKLTISVEGFPALYTMQAQGIDLVLLNDTEINQLRKQFSGEIRPKNNTIDVEKSRQAVAFLNEYKNEGILKVKFRPTSEVPWQISNESFTALQGELQKSKENMVEMTMSAQVEFERPRISKDKEPSKHSTTFEFDARRWSRTLLLQVLNGTEPEMRIAGAIPMYVTVPNEGEVKATNQLQDMGTNVNITDIRGTFNTARMTINNSTQLPIWTTQMDFHPRMASFSPPKTHFPYAPGSNLDYVEMIAFVDRVFPSFIPVQFVQGGIIASYIALVLLVGRLIRGVVTSGPLDVIISEIPNPDYLLKICLDIYLVRESGSRDGNFTLEQDLFAKLIFLFRSPQTLIKWTRYKVMKQD